MNQLSFDISFQQRSDLTLHSNYPVIQVTDKGSFNSCQYFTHRSWIPNTNQLIFVSNRTGIFELFLLDIDKKKLIQLTNNGHIQNFAWGISPNGQSIIYLGGATGQEVHHLDLKTYTDEILFIRPAKYHHWDSDMIDIAPDNDTFYFCWHAFPAYIPSNLFQGSIQNKNFKPLFPDTFEAQTFIDHQMLNPLNPRQMQINFTNQKDMNGKDAPQRMWILDLDSLKSRPLYKQKPHWWSHFQRVCHEAWIPDGAHLCFVVRRNEVRVCNINAYFGHEASWIAAKGPNFWHVSASPSGQYLCADTMWMDSGLWLIEYKPSHKGKLFHLCLTQSDWQNPNVMKIPIPPRVKLQPHPHPGWSSNGNYIHFTAFDPKQNGIHIFLVPIFQNPFKKVS